jgi:hypothetical protein
VNLKVHSLEASLIYRKLYCRTLRTQAVKKDFVDRHESGTLHSDSSKSFKILQSFGDSIDSSQFDEEDTVIRKSFPKAS